jgi:hypothetical protein
MTSRAESYSSANAIVALLDRKTTISFYSEGHEVYADLLIRKCLHYVLLHVVGKGYIKWNIFWKVKKMCNFPTSYTMTCKNNHFLTTFRVLKYTF